MSSLDEILTPVSAWTDVPRIQRDIDTWTAAQRDAFLQMLLNRTEYAKDKAAADLLALVGDGTWAKITSDGGLAVTCTNRSGAKIEAGFVVEPYRGWDVTDATGDFLAVDSVIGADTTNTDAGILYFKVVDAGADNTIEAYSDDARTTKVASGTDVGKAGGVVALAEFGGSGLTSLNVTVDVGVSPSATAYATFGSLSGVVLATTSSIVPCGVVYEDIEDGASGWMTIHGKTMVRFTTDNPFNGYLITSATVAGKVDVLFDLDATKVQRAVGYCPGRGHVAGPGIYGACILTLGRTWGV